MIGDAKIIKETALKNNLDLSGVTIINPNTFDNFSKYANDLYELRKNKGMTLNQAKKANAIARGYVAPTGHDLSLVPGFVDIMIDNCEKTAIKLFVRSK